MLGEFMRKGSWPLVLAAVLAGVAGCGGPTGSGSGSGSAPAGSAGSASGGDIAENLTFTGTIAGHLSRGRRGDVYVCTVGSYQPGKSGSSGNLLVGPILGDVNGTTYQLNIAKLQFHGPGRYDASGVNVSVAGDPGKGTYGPTARAGSTSYDGTLVVNEDLRSGTIDMDLALNGATNPPVAHLRGDWRCPPDAF